MRTKEALTETIELMRRTRDPELRGELAAFRAEVIAFEREEWSAYLQEWTGRMQEALTLPPTERLSRVRELQGERAQTQREGFELSDDLQARLDELRSRVDGNGTGTGTENGNGTEDGDGETECPDPPVRPDCGPDAVEVPVYDSQGCLVEWSCEPLVVEEVTEVRVVTEEDIDCSEFPPDEQAWCQERFGKLIEARRKEREEIIEEAVTKATAVGTGINLGAPLLLGGLAYLLFPGVRRSVNAQMRKILRSVR